MTETLEPQRKPLVADEVAYIAPMATFLALIWIGTTGAETPAGNSWFPAAYAARAVIVGILLVVFRRSYTKIRWDYWWLGAIVGVIGIFQWVGMQLWLQQHVEFFKPSGKVFDPEKFFADPAMRWAFVAVRIFGAAIVVPVMEELFWRDYAWRTVIAPNNFKLAKVGEWDLKAFVVIPLIFALVHGNWWLTSIVWAFMIGGLLVYTRSLGACIIAHAVTNLLLAGYVLWTKDWAFW